MIKVFIQTKKFKDGPAIFRSRIIKAFKKIQNIEIRTDSIDKCDIELGIIRIFRKHKL